MGKMTILTKMFYADQITKCINKYLLIYSFRIYLLPYIPMNVNKPYQVGAQRAKQTLILVLSSGCGVFLVDYVVVGDLGGMTKSRRNGVWGPNEF